MKPFQALYYITKKLLAYNSHAINDILLKKALFSQPDFPSLFAISESLTEFGVDNAVLEIPKPAIQDLTAPFLAIIEKDGMEQIILAIPETQNIIRIYDGESKNKLTISASEFLKLWRGIILAVEPNNTKQSRLHIEKKHILSGFAILALFCLPFTFFNNYLATIQYYLSLIGVFITIAIWYAEAGSESMQNFCNLSPRASCQAVFQSNQSQIANLIPLSLLIGGYFMGQAGLWLIVPVEISKYLYFAHCIALLGTIYTIYLQAYVINKWCPLCLGISGAIWVQAGLSIFTINYPIDWHNYSGYPIFLSLLLISIAFPLAFYIRMAIHQINEIESLEINNVQYRRNYHLFIPWFYEQPYVNTQINGAPFDIATNGNMGAPLEITVLTNPLCEACKKLHPTLKDLAEKYGEDLKMTWRFYVPTETLNDPRTMIAAWLLQTSDGNMNFQNKLDNWYENPSLSAFDSLRIPIVDLKLIIPILKLHRTWCEENNLRMTPMVLLNGRAFPFWYQLQDIKYFIGPLLEAIYARNGIMHQGYPTNGVMLADT